VPILKIISGGTGRFEISQDQVFIGRDPGNDLVIQDAGVSGYHARILKTEHGHLLIEERTSTGIWVQDQRVNNIFLQHGTRFRLGNSVFVFESEEIGTQPTIAAPVGALAGLAELAEMAAPAAAPDPPEAPAVPEARDAPDTPAWADQLADPSQFQSGGLEAIGNECPSCEAPLVGMERFCSLCGARTKYGGRGRVIFFKVIGLFLVLGAGAVGVYMLTDGDLTRDGFNRAVTRALGDRAPPWLKL
jgi:pSer/pThr/pTyr-binding forkhead associated (FHA) protein